MLTNFHTHTVFCDGKNTPEEMVLSAIEKGFTALGFSGHGLTSFDPGYCLRDTAGYRAEILRLMKSDAALCPEPEFLIRQILLDLGTPEKRLRFRSLSPLSLPVSGQDWGWFL